MESLISCDKSDIFSITFFFVFEFMFNYNISLDLWKARNRAIFEGV